MSTESTLSKQATVVSWIAQLVAAGILAMAVVPKLTGAADSIALFETLGVEPWGRFATGVLEAVAVLLLLIPNRKTIPLGGLLGAGVMLGAIGSHLTVLGIDEFFYMALLVLAASVTVVVTRRADLPIGN